jgi:hypothetical protein
VIQSGETDSALWSTVEPQIPHGGLQQGTRFCAMAHSGEPDSAPWPTAGNQNLDHGPQRETRFCAMAHSGDQTLRKQRGTRFSAVAHRGEPDSAQAARTQIQRRGPQGEPDPVPWPTAGTSFCAAAHSAKLSELMILSHKADTNEKILINA